MAVAPAKIRFGCWQLDEQRRSLSADGAPVPLNGRAFDLLSLLVARRGEAVSRDEIVAHVWPGITVGDNNLTVQISNLRRILGEVGPDGVGLIVTVPGRGYKFTGEVTEEVPPLAAGPAPAASALLPAVQAGSMPGLPPAGTDRRWRGPATAMTAVLMLMLVGAASLIWRPTATAPRLSIAVLPFRSLSPDPTQDYADALTDDLTTDLAHIPASTVIARESAAVWRGKTATAQQIAHALRVRYLVEGSILREENRYHVNAQLVDADSGAHLWAARFEAPEGRIGDVRDAIVRRLATALDFQLTQVESARSLHDRPDDPDALDLFFRARAVLDGGDTLASLTEAQRLLERAVKQRPDFADALAELGTLLLAKAHDTDDPDRPADMVEAQKAIGRALSISPTNAKAMAAEGHRLEIGGACIAAIYSAQAALAIEPSSLDAEAVLADCNRKLGHLADAVMHLQALLRLSPDGPKNRRRYLTLGYIHMIQGNPSQAIDELRRSIAGSFDETPTGSMNHDEVAQILLIAATELQGAMTTAHAMVENYQRRWPNRTVWRIGAVFTKADTQYPGTKTLLKALVRAGLPPVADEHLESGNAVVPCPGGDFDETPLTVPGLTTLDTKGVLAALNSKPVPILIDLADGSASPRQAIWYDFSVEQEQTSDFAIRVARAHAASSLDTPIIVMGAGTYGCTSLEAAEALRKKGFTHVEWYRGGEEAWDSQGQQSVDRRPI